MPLKLNVGLMKKIGQPRYGSLSASCHLEIELESSLLERDAEGVQERIRRTFAACRRAVEAELATGDLRRPPCPAAVIETASESAPGKPAIGLAVEGTAVRRPAAGGTHNGAAAAGKANDAELSPASASQPNYARRLASRIGRTAALRVEVLAQHSFGMSLGELSRAEAARLIAMLRAVKSGELDWERLLEDAAA